jgi:CRP/FNR family transcriptional regulator
LPGLFILESASMPADNQSAIPENASPLVRRLGRSVLLTSEEVDYLETMQVNQASIGKGDEFIHDGEPLRVTFLVRRGWVIRYRITPAGRRIIIGVSLPGDFIGLHVNFSHSAIFSAAGLTDTSLALIEPVRILEIHRRFPVLASGLDWMSVRHSNILSEHKVSLGARTAAQRILHFLLELWVRLEQVGLANGKGFELELTQEQIGDCMGLSTVHVNRSLSRLSKENLDQDGQGYGDVPAAVEICQFCRFRRPFPDGVRDHGPRPGSQPNTFTTPEPQLNLCNGPRPGDWLCLSAALRPAGRNCSSLSMTEALRIPLEWRHQLAGPGQSA